MNGLVDEGMNETLNEIMNEKALSPVTHCRQNMILRGFQVRWDNSPLVAMLQMKQISS